MSPDDPRARCEALCDLLLDGALTVAQKAELETLVLESAEARALYVQRMHLHAALRRELGSDAPPLAAVMRPRRARLAYALALPAMLAVGIAVALLWTRPPRAVASLVSAQNARWQDATVPTTVGARLAPGRLALAAGLATIRFDSGAEVVLEGPAVLEVRSPRDCVLHAGGLVARVPPPAVGFTVRSGSVVLVDHGTEFGVVAAPEGETRVQVLSGLVEARHGDAAGVRLATGDTVVFGGDRPGRRTDGEPRTAAFARPTPADLVVSTASGRGRATFVRSRPHATDTLPDGVLLVKNTDDDEWQRKAYVRFDLAALAGRTVADAALTLTAVPTGLGHATFVPDATFAVYGVPDDGDAAWEAPSWQTAPGNARGGGAVDARAVPVGTFVVPQGTMTGAFTVRGPALTRFLAADRDGLVTFLIVRQTAELRRSGLVHGFAGNHHPTAAPPTLRLSVR